MGLALGTNLKFYTSVAKGLDLKVRKFCGLIPTFLEVTEEKLVAGGGLFDIILNRVNNIHNRSVETGDAAPPQIFAKADLLLVDNNSEKKNVAT